MSITSRLGPRIRLARAQRPPARELFQIGRRWLERALRWRALARERRALLELDDHLLKDIGISRLDAVREASRPFWDDAGQRWRDWR